ncbi:hypothetical protein [Geothermobacter hydrogeniphilus]|uniref:7-cyano-7-deazaguanine synthase (Queuosine biosynthesis) n=1 Tax=Geothermobacter hydrogeniphilus TaxID=1969733 RepID=A0A1X0Y651_9BACT|nr:hypothetical protein [Geothermobacter hydrogeniphilus]ORJ60635.1 hypothetical protein B5V00_07315 [Geothermobacter hydrogeniphilus]
MKITDLRRERIADRVRVSARVEWEDCDQPGRDVFLETTERCGSSLNVNPDTFLVGCLVPAMHLGEKRVAIDAAVCPELLETLETAMALLHTWYGSRYQPLVIETAGVRMPAADRPERAAIFLSGGIDSLSALRRNLQRYPAGHPSRVRDAFLVHGFDIGGVVERGLKYPVFDRAVQAMTTVAEEAELELIPVYTNLRHLCDERELWLKKFHGAVLAAVAHGFTSRIHRVELASTWDLQSLAPSGSHPLLDPLYGSSELRIYHRDVELRRIDKLRIVSDWEVAFQNFRVCLQNVPDRLNCGWCEKCVRTMTGLVAIGKLAETRAFVEDDVSHELLDRTQMAINHRDPFYAELIEPLRQQQRDDLADIIVEKLAAGSERGL